MTGDKNEPSYTELAKAFWDLTKKNVKFTWNQETKDKATTQPQWTPFPSQRV